MKLGLREIVFLTALLGLLGASYFVLFTKQDAARREKIARRDSRQKALDDVAQAAASVRDVDGKIAELQKAIEYFESRLPQAKEMDRVLKEVSQLADANGLRTQTVRTPASQRMAGVREQTVELSLSGDFRNGFYPFMLQLETMPRLTRVTKMNLTKITDKDGEMDASLTMSIYFDPETPGAAGMTASAAQ